MKTKYTVITGASSGIGRAVALKFAERNKNKELYIVKGAVHTDLYDGGGKNLIPFDKFESFFKNNLK